MKEQETTTQQQIAVESLVAPMALEELTKEASVIVNGVVDAVHPGTLTHDQLTNRRLVYTDTTINVVTTYKGKTTTGSIIVRILGGATPELSMSVPDAPQFAPK